MKQTSSFYLIIVGILAVCLSCNKDKITFQNVVDYPTADFTDSNGYFILNQNSISYYNLTQNRVYNHLFAHINNRELTGLHSFDIDKDTKIGVITLENEKRIEFINPFNFLSLGYVDIRDEPHQVTMDHVNQYNLSKYALISAGQDPGNVIVLDCYAQRILYRLKTGVNPGKIFIGDLIYVLNSSDSTITVINRDYDDYKVIDTITVGLYPVDMIRTEDRDMAAILCNGKNRVASIVIYDLFVHKIVHTFYFDDPAFKPAKLYRINYNKKIAEFIENNTLYQANLANLSERSILTNLKIVDIISSKQELAVSTSSNNQKGRLYLMNKTSHALIDSLTIDGLPHQIVHF